MKYESTSDILVVLVETTDDRTEVMQRLGYLGDQPKPVLVVLPGDAVLRRPGDLRELRYVIESQGHQGMLVIVGNERLRLWAHRQGYIVFSSIETCVSALLQQGIVAMPQLLQEARLAGVSLSVDGEEHTQSKAGGTGDRWEEGTQGETYSPQMRYLNSRKDSLGGVIAQEYAWGEHGRDKAGPYITGGEEVMAVWVADMNNVVDRDTEPLHMRVSGEKGRRIFHEEELFYPERVEQVDARGDGSGEGFEGGERHGRDKAGPYITGGMNPMGVMDLAYVGVRDDMQDGGQAAARMFFVEEDMPSMPERGSGEEELLMLPEWARNGMAWGAQFDTGRWEQVKGDKVLGLSVAAGIVRDRVLIALILLLGIGIAGGVLFGSILYR